MQKSFTFFLNRCYGKTAGKVSLLSALLLVSGGAIATSTTLLLAPATVMAQVPTTARVFYVNSATGTDSPTAGMSEATPLRTIARALQMASSGSIVQVSPGTYSEASGENFPLMVPQGVTLRGDESNQGQAVIITGGGGYISPIEAGNNITLLARPESMITGLTITNPNSRGTGVLIETSVVTVRNNTFANNQREGVFVTGTASPTIESNIFTRNSGSGITLTRSSRGEIRNNRFFDTGFGMAVHEKASPMVSQNHFSQNLDGMVIASDATPTLRGNVIENNKRDGIVVATRARPDLGGRESPGQNQVRNNTRFDLNNGTRNPLVSYGNAIAKTNGLVTSQAAVSSSPLPPLSNLPSATTPSTTRRVFEWRIR